MKTIKIKVTENNETRIEEFGVNDNGNGLWKNDKQIKGTCDFSAYTAKALIRKIKQIYYRWEIESGAEVKMIRGSAQGW